MCVVANGYIARWHGRVEAYCSQHKDLPLHHPQSPIRHLRLAQSSQHILHHDLAPNVDAALRPDNRRPHAVRSHSPHVSCARSPHNGNDRP